MFAETHVAFRYGWHEYYSQSTIINVKILLLDRIPVF